MAQKGTTLAHTEFPLYTIRMLGDKYFMVAGGGGQAKTGIPNAIEIFELKQDNGKCIANTIQRYVTEAGAIMNSAVYHQDNAYHLITGIDGKCHVFSLRLKVVTLKEQSQASTSDNVRKRKGNTTQSETHNIATKVTKFEVEPGLSVQTDFSADDGFQKAVSVIRDKSVVATGGADGFLRLWETSNMSKLYEVKAHTNEIDDIDISPTGKNIVTVSRDSHAYIWKTEDGSKFIELVWPQKTNGKYRCRNCRFGAVVDKDKKPVLFTTHIPAVRGRTPDPCYITKWDTTKYAPKRIVNAGKEVLSAAAITADGIYLGVGTISGSVSVYIAFSLQRLYHLPQAHNIFVTGLEFTLPSEESRAVTGGHDFTLLSISADNTVKLHQEPPRGLWSPLWAVAGFIIIIYFLFWFVSSVGI